MPRDGSGIYVKPFPDVVEGTTIESTVHNGEISDIEYDLNFPRPIVAGGTGANNAIQARDNLDAEAAQQTVTNYDTQVWENGSFWSAPGAIGAPDNPTGASAFFYAGICYKISEAAMFLEARRDGSTGGTPPKWVKTKWASWGAWSKQVTSIQAGAAEGISGVAADMFFGTTTAPGPAFIVNTESDVSGTNALTVRKDGVTAVRTPAGDALIELAALPGRTAQLTGSKNGAARWNLRMADATSETGGNVGSDFWLYGVDDANTTVTANGIQINRKFGTITLGGNTTITGSLNTSGNISATGDIITLRAGAPTTGYMFLGNSGTRYLGWDGTQFAFNGPLTVGSTIITGSLVVNGGCTVNANIVSAINTTDGGYYFGSSASKSITVSGGQFHFNGGSAWFGAVNAQVDAPCAAGTNASGAWPMGVSAVDRGILFMQTSPSNLVLYFTQGSTSNAVGSVNTSSVATVYNTASSAELKEDLKSFDAGNIIDQTNVYDFAWKKTGERSFGVIAQQAIDVYPMAVTHTEVKVPDGEVSEFWGVDYSKYVPVLLQELKALRARVFELEGRVGVGTNPA